MEIALLVNPAAGQGKGAQHAELAAESLRSAGFAVIVLAGRDAGHARLLADSVVTSGIGALVVCGGDGMVHLALQSVAESATALGVIPSGTGNDFARMLGIPLGDPGAAARIVAGQQTIAIDLGRAGPEWFGTVLATGFDSRVSDRVNRMRWPRGRARFNLAVVAELARFKPLKYRIILDDRETELEAMLVAVGNGSSYGGGMRICPDADPTDGLFDVTVVTKLSRSRLIRLFPTVYPGKHVDQVEVLTFRAAQVSVAADDVSGYADGELVAPLPVSCRVVAGAVRVYVPGSV